MEKIVLKDMYSLVEEVKNHRVISGACGLQKSAM